MHGHMRPRQQIPRFESSQSPLLQPPPVTSWFGWTVCPGLWKALRSSGAVAALVGGGKYVILGDWRGLASGTMSIVLLRGTSGRTFSGRGPGELGGDTGGSVYVYDWGDSWVLRGSCSSMVV